MSRENGQTIRMHRSHQNSSASAMAGNLTDVMHDITQLAELQAKLFATDSKAALRRAVLPTVAMMLGICCLLGCIPVVLLAAAEVIQTLADVSRSIALACSAAAGLIVAVALLAIGWWRLRRGLHEFDRSRTELSQNIAWVKHTLQRSHG